MFYVDQQICTGCGVCIDACPVGALSLVDGKARIEPDQCNECSACVRVCPQEAIRSDIRSQPNILSNQGPVFPDVHFGMGKGLGRGIGRGLGRGMGRGLGRGPRDGRGRGRGGRGR